MKNVKYVLENFSFYDFKSVEKRLEKMASKGWQLEKVIGSFWKYKRIVPRKVKISTMYIADTLYYDPLLEEKLSIMEEYALKDGWKILTRWKQMQIFYNEEENPKPIETDALVQVENINKFMIKHMFQLEIYVLIFSLLQLIPQIQRFFYNKIEFLSSSKNLTMITMFTLIALSSFSEIATHLIWYRKAKVLAKEDGIFLPLKKSIYKAIFIFKILTLAYAVLIFEYKLILIVVIVLLFLIVQLGSLFIGYFNEETNNKKFKLKNKYLTGALMFISIAALFATFAKVHSLQTKIPIETYQYNGSVYNVYNDEIPISIEELINVDGNWSKESEYQESFMFSMGQYEQNTILFESENLPEIDYKIIDIKLSFLYDFVKENILNKYKDKRLEDGSIFYNTYIPIEEKLWEANKVYKLDSSKDYNLYKYLICWDSRILEIRFSWEPTNEQIKYIVEKIGDM